MILSFYPLSWLKFCRGLNKDNPWVKSADTTDRNYRENHTTSDFMSKKSMPATSLLVIGVSTIKNIGCRSDEGEALCIREHPYIRYLMGLKYSR